MDELKRLGNLKHFYDKIVNLNTKYAEHIIVAGGCLRDTYLGNQIKDIDIFFSGMMSSIDILRGLKKEIPEFEDCKYEFFSEDTYGGDEEYDGDSSVHDVTKVTLKNGINIDIVATAQPWERPEDLLASLFDCSMNALAYTKNGLMAPHGLPTKNGIYIPLGGAFIYNPIGLNRMKHLVSKCPNGKWDNFKHLFKEEEWKEVEDLIEDLKDDIEWW